MKILAIETSCDETAAAVIEDGRKILSNTIYSQIEIHRLYGGVVPEIASRNHLDKISQIINLTLEESSCSFADIDAIAVTIGPGLVGALLVGINYAKSLAYALNKPIIPVNHMEGHIAASYLSFEDLKPPFLCVVVSGGHTYLAIVRDYTDIEVIGTTLDDAIGEAYDKVARTLGMTYPGGPQVDKAAKIGNPEAIHFKRTYLYEKDDECTNYNFSFSGIKSGVLNYINNSKQKNIEYNIPDIAASFQASVLDVLVNKSLRAAKQYKLDKIVLAGGVAANSRLREMMKNYKNLTFDNGDNFKNLELEIYYPNLSLCTDNAAMIGSQAYYRRKSISDSPLKLNAIPNLQL